MIQMKLLTSFAKQQKLNLMKLLNFTFVLVLTHVTQTNKLEVL